MAAFIAWKLVVAKATNKEMLPAMANIDKPIFTLNAKLYNH